MQEKLIIKSTRQWVESVVVGLNLCPFAKRELMNDAVRIRATNVDTEEKLLLVLQDELELLHNNAAIETTLLVHPEVLQIFHEYNQFLNFADNLLIEMKLEGVYQIASFHPDYQYADTAKDDVENYTNRSPYPMLHLLREDSLEKVIAEHPDTDQIPIRNIELMKSMGKNKLDSIMQTCFKE